MPEGCPKVLTAFLKALSMACRDAPLKALSRPLGNVPTCKCEAQPLESWVGVMMGWDPNSEPRHQQAGSWCSSIVTLIECHK